MSRRQRLERWAQASKEMADAWARFAKTGNPNSDSASVYRLIDFGDTTTVEPIGSNAGIDFFEETDAKTRSLPTAK
jgi:hypothetical protein